jgi:hypothetical protein
MFPLLGTHLTDGCDSRAIVDETGWGARFSHWSPTGLSQRNCLVVRIAGERLYLWRAVDHKAPGHHHPVVTGQHAGDPIVIAGRFVAYGLRSGRIFDRPWSSSDSPLEGTGFELLVRALRSACSTPAEPMVCGLSAGGDWIRTSYAEAVKLVVAAFSCADC